MTINAIIFDLGGTLLHYHDPLTTDHQRHFRRITLKGFNAVLQRLHELGVETPPVEECTDRGHGLQVFGDILYTGIS